MSPDFSGQIIATIGSWCWDGEPICKKEPKTQKIGKKSHLVVRLSLWHKMVVSRCQKDNNTNKCLGHHIRASSFNNSILFYKFIPSIGLLTFRISKLLGDCGLLNKYCLLSFGISFFHLFFQWWYTEGIGKEKNVRAAWNVYQNMVILSYLKLTFKSLKMIRIQFVFKPDKYSFQLN